MRTRERWGTFSVKDHVSQAPFVTDVLLYDRLVIPVPAAGDRKEWAEKKWHPALLEKCLNVLQVKTDNQDGLALTVPWDESKRARFEKKMSLAPALAMQQREPEADYYLDPFHMTRQLIKDEFRPALPAGIAKAWVVAAYPSAARFHKDAGYQHTPGAADSGDETRRLELAAVLRHRFLTPQGRDPDQELLKRAVDLATQEDYRRKRDRFYAWQEEIIEEDIRDDQAVAELEQLLVEYNEATRQAFDDVVARFVFTVIPIGLGLAGAAAAGPSLGLSLATASGLVQLLSFYHFERKVDIDAGDLDAAAMVHDARRVLFGGK